MTHHNAFLQAILENPDDDTPRLVYADYLDEHGEPDRAEFIRVQCQLARLPPDDPRQKELQARQGQLLAGHEKEWLGSLCPWVTAWTFRRGFMEEVNVSPQGCLDHAASLPHWAPIRRLRLDLSRAVIPPNDGLSTG